MKIEGFEKPKRSGIGRSGSDIYGLRAMAVGESAFHGARVTDDISGEMETVIKTARRLSNAIAFVQKSKGMKFSTSTVRGDTTYGNWTAPSDGVVVTRTA
jgi:hypothetical protein